MSDSRTSPGRMAVMGSIEAAIGRSRDMLFRPFDAQKWLCLGIIIFIASLGSCNGGGGGSNGVGSGGGGAGNAGGGGEVADGLRFEPAELILTFESHFLGSLRSAWELLGHASEHLGNWIWFVYALCLAFLLAGLAFGLVLAYLGSRGQLMFVRAVAKDDAGIGSNWKAAGPHATSLFLFNIVFGLASGLVLLLVVAFGYAAIHGRAVAEVNDIWAYVAGLVPYILALLALAVLFSAIKVLVSDFVVAIMYSYDLSCIRAIGEFTHLMRGNILRLILFLCVKLLYSVVFGVTCTVIGCLTCCIGILPIIHQTLFAPYYVFDRAFSLYMLQSAWPEAFRIEEVTPPPPPPEDLPQPIWD